MEKYRIGNKKEYKDLIFEEISANFRRILIKSLSNNYFIKIDKNRTIILESIDNKEIDPFIWYVTIIRNEITFFSNESYLGVNENNNNVTGQEYMKRWKFEIEKNLYIFYNENEGNTLTIKNNKAFISQKLKDNETQLFSLVDIPLELKELNF